MNQMDTRWLGRLPFAEAEFLQASRREEVLAGACDSLWFAEHDSVYVVGRRAPASEDMPSVEWLEESGIPLVRSRRGGLVTFHGPGQLMAYCIVDVKRLGITVPDLVCVLEQGVIDWLASFEIIGCRISGASGVWVGGRKICAVGLHFRRWVSMYGVCVNLDPDLQAFRHIRPCGFSGQDITSVRQIRGSILEPKGVWEGLSRSLIASLDSKAVDRDSGKGYPPTHSGT